MDMVTRIQVLKKIVRNSHRANAFGKSMNPIILSPAMKKVEQTGFFSFDMETDLGVEKPVKLLLKSDLVSLLTRAE